MEGFEVETKEDGQTMAVAELNDDSLAVALLSCYEEQAFFLAARLFDSVYESSIFLGASDLSEGVYDVARAVYGGGCIHDRIRLAQEAIENFFTTPTNGG